MNCCECKNEDLILNLQEQIKVYKLLLKFISLGEINNDKLKEVLNEML